jgi:AraC-like DNA-binding protein
VKRTMAASGAPAISAAHLIALTTAFGELGLDTKALMAGLGALPSDADRPIPLATLTAAWVAGVQAWGSQSLGLRAGLAMPFGCFGLIEYLAASSTHVRDAFRRIQRFARVIEGSPRYEIIESERWIRFEPRRAMAVPPMIDEYGMAFLVTQFRRHGPRNFDATIRFAHQPLGSPEEYAALADRVIFGCPRAAIELTPALWGARMRRPDPELAQLLEGHAEARLGGGDAHGEVTTGPDGDDWLARLHDVLRDELAGGDVGLVAVAAKLGMAPRTLQRWLHEHGMNYQELVSERRRVLACHLLKVQTLSIGEVAHMVGYPRVSAFHRAFKRWTGTSPQAYRRRVEVDARGVLRQRVQQ